MSPADEVAAKPNAAGSGEKSDEQLGAIPENLERVGLQWSHGGGWASGEG